MGSGWFELRQDGRFYNWNIVNNQPYGTGARLAADLAENARWFAVRFHEQGCQPRINLLQLPLRHDAASFIVQLATYPWLTAVARIDYEASFPFSRLKFTDPQMPLVVELEAFLNALLGLSIRDGRYEFAPRLPDKNQTLFFAIPNATGHYVRKVTGRKETMMVRILTGSFTCRELTFATTSEKRAKISVNVAGTVTRKADRVVITFPQALTVQAGEVIEVHANLV